jgi:hypothetical protein
MPKVYVTQIPHVRHKETGALVPAINISPALEHGEVVIMMPEKGNFSMCPSSLIDQIRDFFGDYNHEDGDCILAIGDTLITSAACGILAADIGEFWILKWEKPARKYLKVLMKFSEDF